MEHYRGALIQDGGYFIQCEGAGIDVLKEYFPPVSIPGSLEDQDHKDKICTRFFYIS